MRALSKCLLAILLALTLAAGCGNGNNGNNGETNNTTNDNASTNNDNASTNNETASTNNETTTETNQNTNNDQNNLPDEPFISEFAYYEESDSGFGTTQEGVTVNIAGLQISNFEGLSKSLDQADAQTLTQDHFGQETMDAMMNGWDCPDPSGGDMGADAGADAGSDMGTTLEESTWWFEARIQDGGGTRHIQEITGCVNENDPAVMAIINALDELATQYDI